MSRRDVVLAALWSSQAKRANPELLACLSVPPRLCPVSCSQGGGSRDGAEAEAASAPPFPPLGGQQ